MRPSIKVKQWGRLTAVAAGLLSFGPFAGAAVTSIQADGSYSLGGGVVTSLTAGPQSSGNVDVLTFPGPYGQADSAGIHTYGSDGGYFGSRSSGFGTYDVTGRFRIVEDIFNNSAVAQNATFNFFITPGQISNQIAGPLTGSDFLTAGLVFDIRRDNNLIYGSSGTILSNSGGTTFTTTGDASLYSGAGAAYTVLGGSRSVDLGVINAGGHITLSYQLDSFARGSSAAGAGAYVDPTDYFVPDTWVEQIINEPCYGGGFLGRAFNNEGYGNGYGGGNLPECIKGQVLIPGHTVHVDGYFVPAGQASGSIGQSGDPFEIVLDGGINTYTDPRIGPFGSDVVFSDVPEPSSLALLLAGMGIFGWQQRRRRTATA